MSADGYGFLTAAQESRASGGEKGLYDPLMPPSGTTTWTQQRKEW
jgi:hypothetical protein